MRGIFQYRSILFLWWMQACDAAAAAPPPVFVLGPAPVAIVADAGGRAEVQVPDGVSVLALQASAPNQGLLSYSLAGTGAGDLVHTETQLQVIGLPVPDELELEKPEQPLAWSTVPAPPAPDVRLFWAPAGRGRKDSVRVTARKMAESAHVTLYAEKDNPMVRAVAQDLVRYAETVALPKETAWFGAVPDVDGDGRLFLLATSAVNNYSSDAGQFTGGFFASKDQTKARESNRADILYLYLPLPVADGGAYNRATQYEYMLKEVIVHELQHMINYAARGGVVEHAWLNEGLSHWAEEALGFHRSNSIRARRFFADTSQTPLVGNAMTLPERGAEFLYVKYLTERFGLGILRRLSAAGPLGVANIERATGMPFHFTLRDWGAWLASTYGDVLTMSPWPNESVRAQLMATATIFLRVKGPARLLLQSAPEGRFQAVGLPAAIKPALID